MVRGVQSLSLSYSSYEEASQCWENAEYGGPWREGDNAAHYDLFSAGGEDFIAVHLPYGHSTLLGHYPWANEVLAAYPDRNAIILTHQYLRASDDPAAESGLGRYGIDPLYGFGGHAPMLRERVVNQNDNVFLVLSGHYHGVAWEVNYGNEGRWSMSSPSR
ncbi:hypothetical protein HGQ17_10050 [Nesterenkonia sp. MY13]|uniref:Calcineurin-like phosphoesterase domain-containing protein n=1 Tax=Nesterenkonia sedimenti TaxID=1463632 RepID=A0A7X8YE17_9MICC|nr:hypothetical protein [Nesterenkonia sedimenti]NLS10328.1 hypothetical protein [Nesterenkonia sedimenti]